MSDENKTDWGEIGLVIVCTIGGAAITVGLIYVVAQWNIYF